LEYGNYMVIFNATLIGVILAVLINTFMWSLVDVAVSSGET
jgi:hypothetical protein